MFTVKHGIFTIIPNKQQCSDYHSFFDIRCLQGNVYEIVGCSQLINKVLQIVLAPGNTMTLIYQSLQSHVHTRGRVIQPVVCPPQVLLGHDHQSGLLSEYAFRENYQIKQFLASRLLALQGISILKICQQFPAFELYKCLLLTYMLGKSLSAQALPLMWIWL